MILNRSKFEGFTLLEMLLVTVIVASILIMLVTYTSTKTDESKRDFTATQSEQILNAGLAYYINNSTWPDTIDQLKTAKYLPSQPIKNAWGKDYIFYKNLATGTFSICSEITGRSVNGTYTSIADASSLAGRLPLAYVTTSCAAGSNPPNPATCNNTPCAVVSTVNIPGQNLNNARSINFAGLYHNGACVPAPICPNPYSAQNTTGMKPAIIVAPVAVSGTYEGTDIVYPLSSFTAYAVGAPSGNTATTDPGSLPGICTNPVLTEACSSLEPAGVSGLSYWRVCLDVVTERGRISGSGWTASSGTIMAITRCVPNNEPSGSAFSVFTPY